MCKKLFCGIYGRSNLKRHISAVHEGKKSFQHNHCQKKFAYKADLKCHTGEKPYSYKTCNKCQLKNHTLINTGEKPYSLDNM